MLNDFICSMKSNNKANKNSNIQNFKQLKFQAIKNPNNQSIKQLNRGGVIYVFRKIKKRL